MSNIGDISNTAGWIGIMSSAYPFNKDLLNKYFVQGILGSLKVPRSLPGS